MKRYELIAILTLFALSGCTATAPKPAAYQLDQNNKYLPVNIEIYAGAYVTPQMSNIVRYMQESIVGSNLFSDVSTGFKRWPLTIQLKYEITRDFDALDFAGTIVSAATLLIVPAQMSELHKLEANIYSGSQMIRSYRYEEKAGVTMSLFHNPEEERKAGARLLINKFFSDLEKHHAIPKIGEVNRGQNYAAQNEKDL